MITVRVLRRFGAFVTMPILLAGCISLLPKTPPAQLYRFGAGQGSVPAPSAAGFAVRLAPINFETASANDRILTVEGDKTAYITGARWVTSATTLFEAAVDQAFASHAGPTRLLARGEISRPDYVLKLDVRRFEARYDNGAGSAPRVAIEVYAALDDPSRPAAHRQRTFHAVVPAGDNRVGEIVPAFDAALNHVLSELTVWVDAGGGA